MADEMINNPSVPANPAMEPEALNAEGSTGSTTSGAMGTTSTSPHTEEARSRFNAALEEAKAGASALKDEATARASAYRDQARGRGENWTAEARTRAGDLAVEGKAKASGALLGLSRLVDENAATIDQNLGPRYGDYARSAADSLRETADSLERKSVDELGEDARTFVRESPAAAVGLAALAGFIVARIFRK
jgi:ElaB/YqjD/DUF883 family membrane-anchored ribosome-binding protein